MNFHGLSDFKQHFLCASSATARETDFLRVTLPLCPTPFSSLLIPVFTIPDSAEFFGFVDMVRTSFRFRLNSGDVRISNLIFISSWAERWRVCEAMFGVIQGQILPLFHGNMLSLISINLVEQLNCLKQMDLQKMKKEFSEKFRQKIVVCIRVDRLKLQYCVFRKCFCMVCSRTRNYDLFDISVQSIKRPDKKIKQNLKLVVEVFAGDF